MELLLWLVELDKGGVIIMVRGVGRVFIRWSYYYGWWSWTGVEVELLLWLVELDRC